MFASTQCHYPPINTSFFTPCTNVASSCSHSRKFEHASTCSVFTRSIATAVASVLHADEHFSSRGQRTLLSPSDSIQRWSRDRRDANERNRVRVQCQAALVRLRADSRLHSHLPIVITSGKGREGVARTRGTRLNVSRFSPMQSIARLHCLARICKHLFSTNCVSWNCNASRTNSGTTHSTSSVFSSVSSASRI